MLACARIASAETETETLPVNRMSSAVMFTVYAKALFTFKEQGRFRNFDGEVVYDPARPDATRVDVTVYTASVDTSNHEHDQMLRSDDFFDIDQYPTMHFVSTGASVRPDGGLSVSGDLTIRGVTRHLDEVPVRIQQLKAGNADAGARFETSFDIDRTEFGLNGSPKFSGFKVSIAKKVNIHLVIAAALPRIVR
jgi:polyisoprenoid-binding protein YceI